MHNPPKSYDPENGVHEKPALAVKEHRGADSGGPTGADSNLVSWGGSNDLENPQNWTLKKKWLITGTLCFNCLAISISSSVIAPALLHIALEFGCNIRVATLALSLYVLGWAMGPLVFSPMSEIYGRNAVYIPTWFLFFFFTLGAALAKNLETLLVCRALAGIFSSPLTTNFGGSMMDIFDDKQLGPAVFLMVAVTFMGPSLGPIIGGYLTQHQGWRWTLWFIAIYVGVPTINWLWLPETHHQTLLTRRAKRLRKATENPNLQSEIERHGLDKKKIFRVAIWRPLQLLAGEPIVLLLGVYVAFVWGIMYIYLGGFPIVFETHYFWNEGDAGASLTGIVIGVLSAIPFAGYSNRLYFKLSRKHGGGSIFPEGRLPMAMVAAILLPISCFWFGWTGRGNLHWMAPVSSGVPFGWSMMMVFLCSTTYIANAFPTVVSSALASISLLRCIFAAAFPLFTTDFYGNLKVQWAGTLLGCLSIVFVPIPFLFYRYGLWLRSKSRFKPMFA